MRTGSWRQIRPAVESLEGRCLLDGMPLIPNLPSTSVSASTVPANGDQNPYGVAFVPRSFPPGGPLHPGDILVSNFNNAGNPPTGNLQGTGTTIVDISPNGHQSLFFQAPASLGPVGLTTALGILPGGFVIVGSLPTLDGTSATVQAPGALYILNRQGKVVETLSSKKFLDGPWDLTVHRQGDSAQVFVSNVLSGTVTRLDLAIPEHGVPIVEHMTQIASGYTFRTDPSALLVGPTGLAYDARRDLLYVASTNDNEIFAIPDAGDRHSDAGTGSVVVKDPVHLHGPLALALTPNGDLITSNGDAVNFDPKHVSEIVEFTPSGRFVAQFQIDPNAGAAFGLAVHRSHDTIRFAAVDDFNNMLGIWTIPDEH